MSCKPLLPGLLPGQLQLLGCRIQLFVNGSDRHEMLGADSVNFVDLDVKIMGLERLEGHLLIEHLNCHEVLGPERADSFLAIGPQGVSAA